MSGKDQQDGAAGIGGADWRAELAHMDTRTRADVLAEATARREQGVLFAQRQLVAWQRTAGARQRSIPQSLHQFNDS